MVWNLWMRGLLFIRPRSSLCMRGVLGWCGWMDGLIDGWSNGIVSFVCIDSLVLRAAWDGLVCFGSIAFLCIISRGPAGHELEEVTSCCITMQTNLCFVAVSSTHFWVLYWL